MSDIVIGALISTIGMVIIGGIGYFTGRRKNDGDAAQSISNAASNAVEGLLKPLTEKVEELRREVEKQKRLNKRFAERIIVLMRGIERLMAQIIRLGHVPEWMPEEWSPEDEEG